MVWNDRLCTAFRQVSRLIDHRIRHLPGFPVIYRLLLLNYGDEFVQDLHLFPFSPEPIIHIFLESLLWHLTAPYLFFGYYSIYHLKLQIILIILYSINLLKSSVGSKPSTFIIPIASSHACEFVIWTNLLHITSIISSHLIINN